jgi:hypothetical protein
MKASDRWERLSVLFEGALVLPPAERDDYLRVHCSDPGIAAEIRAQPSRGATAMVTV